ncbi:hypothetical protein COEREDRAFT_87147 [Coemansia reversa NRRL 1564]|uniref:F-box domain-containing protein n=1 Tax=Coemansia reversa (strain ATCC 12441 / NRRL 1564) TaxID=763665 RepID=A0A2G5BAY6_COERN|nr:hypothetical protein COEREDRAFT_87147 [Coemansia reversa NRRL 1564]|eukprot:PIA16176.1 hypothetical protein COEREDRAFT_87147 [Coemansia reversa NRRL 1564]
MSVAASFQNLPEKVILSIIPHLQTVGKARVYANRNGTPLSRYVAIELLHINRTWRSAVMQVLCSEYRLHIFSRNSGISGEFSLWPTGLLQPDQQQFKHVSKLVIVIDHNCIFNGMAVHSIYRAWNNCLIFSNVTNLNLVIEYNHIDHNLLMHDYNSHAHVFAKHLRSMVPQMQTVDVKYSAYTQVKDMTTEQSLNKLLTSVMHNTVYSSLTICNNDFLSNYYPHVKHTLSRIDCCWDEGYAKMLPLIHETAETLQELKLACHGISREMLNKLFLNSTGNYIIYHQLEKLVFEATANWEKLHRPTLPQYVFFPKLCYLYLGIVYPFNDDILFRGNSATLEYLCITPDLDMVNMLNKYRVFAEQKHTRLRHIIVNNQFNSEHLITEDALMQLANAIARVTYNASSAVESITMHNSSAGEKLVAAMIQSMHMTFLKQLHIESSRLSLTDIVNLLQALPRLVELHCMCDGIGEESAGVPVKQLADYMYHNYYPLSTSFKYWKIVHDYKTPLSGDKSIGDMVICSLLVSVVCPNFKYPHISEIFRLRFNNTIKQAIAYNPADKLVKNMKALIISE